MTERLEPIREEHLNGLPGADIVRTGLQELREGAAGECGLSVLIASPSLIRLGIEVPTANNIPRPWEHQLYSLLESTHANGAYSRYNSLLRRMASFLHALAQE